MVKVRISTYIKTHKKNKKTFMSCRVNIPSFFQWIPKGLKNGSLTSGLSDDSNLWWTFPQLCEEIRGLGGPGGQVGSPGEPVFVCPIFLGINPPKTRPFPVKRMVIWVPGIKNYMCIYIYISYIIIMDAFHVKFVGTYTIPIDPMGCKGSTLPKTHCWKPKTCG